MSTPPEDRFICSAWNEAAIAAGMNDKDAALEFVKKFASFEGKLRLTAIGLASGIGSTPERPSFVGRPIVSKFPGRCAVCALSFNVGADVLYNGDRKRAAHLRCGEVG